MITEEILLNNNWKKKLEFPNTPQEFAQWDKEINGFYYTLTDLRNVEAFNGGNWFDWNCHIDNPDFASVANFEVNNLEDINIISKIYIK